MEKTLFFLPVLSLVISAAFVQASRNGCIPPSGRTALIIGQDYHTIKNYSDLFADSFGLMSYTALTGVHGNLTGLSKPIDYGSGTQWALGLARTYPKSTLQLGLYLVDTYREVIRGNLDTLIDSLAQFIRGPLGNTTVYLRIGYEFDNVDNAYAPNDYVAAYRHIARRFGPNHNDVPNALFVWHSAGVVRTATVDDGPLQGVNVGQKLHPRAWYPGSDVVDVCGVSIFDQPYKCEVPLRCRMLYAETLANFCQQQERPLMIAESAPIGGIIDEGMSGAGPNLQGVSGSSWSKWFGPVLEFINRFDVAFWCYIDSDWEQQPMWKGGKWGDTKLEHFKMVALRWKTDVLESSRFHWGISYHQGGLEGEGQRRDHVCKMGARIARNVTAPPVEDGLRFGDDDGDTSENNGDNSHVPSSASTKKNIHGSKKQIPATTGRTGGKSKNSTVDDNDNDNADDGNKGESSSSSSSSGGGEGGNQNSAVGQKLEKDDVMLQYFSAACGIIGTALVYFVVTHYHPEWSVIHWMHRPVGYEYSMVPESAGHNEEAFVTVGSSALGDTCL